jgi:diguanylate cyclase (GGDEF)-like protein
LKKLGVFDLKNKLVRRMFIVLLVTVITVSGTVYVIVYTFSFRAIVDDMRQRADGIRGYVMSTIAEEDVLTVGSDYAATDDVRDRLMVTLHYLRNTVNLNQLYIARFDGSGHLFTSLIPDKGDLLPAGQLLDDLTKSVEDVQLVTSNGLYRTARGHVFSAFWPVLDSNYDVIGVVCMEFNVDGIYESYRLTLFYSLGISLMVIVLLTVVAYLVLSKSTENIYKKLVYLDLLTGYENRMAFEQRLVACEEFVKKGDSIAIVVFYLLNLKMVNDTYGFETGDSFIKNTADVIAGHIGKPECVYRVGGEAFAAVLVGFSWSELQNIIESIKNDKREVIKDFPFSCAVGMARLDRTGDISVKDVLDRAENAMLEDKQRYRPIVHKELDIDKEDKHIVDVLRDQARADRRIG